MIRTENLSFYYRDNPQKKILHNLNITFNQEDLTIILGPNGSGKTTLIKLLARLLNPTRGNLFLENKLYIDIDIKDFYKKVSYVPQKFYSIYPYTIYDVVMMGRSLYFGFLGFESKSDVEKVNEILKKFEIDHLRKKKITELSGGELQKVILARSLVQESEILLLDEPNTHLDLKHQIQIFDLLKNLIIEGKTVIAVSHDINLASFYADRILFLKDGKIRYDCKPASKLSSKIIREIFEIENEVLFDSQMGVSQIIIKPGMTRID